MKDDIIISAPTICQTENSSIRLSAEVSINGEKKILWCETDQEYEQFLLLERLDAFLVAILPLAMRIGKNIICEAPVTEQFLHNLNQTLIPLLCKGDSRLFNSKIIANTDSSKLISENGIATGMSCGVDSLYTTLMYLNSPFASMNLTHLYTGNYLYGNKGAIYDRADSVAKTLNLKLVKTRTNISELFKQFGLPHVPTHFFKTIFGVLCLRKLFKIYYYSSAGDFASDFLLKNNSDKDTTNIELLLLYTFSCPDFQILTGGGSVDRLQKTKELINFGVAQKYLNVCLNPYLNINCGKCGKCLRTLLAIDTFDALDSFRNVFDVDEYRKNRLDAFLFLVKGSPLRNPYLSGVYQYFLSKEPDLIKQAETQLKNNL
jgi:hypothetical protein